MTLFLDFSPGAPPIKKTRIIAQNESERLAGTVHEMQLLKLVVREMIKIIISKECFSQFFFNGFVFLAELDKPNEIERSLACDFDFVCASQRTLSDAKKGSWLYGLVVPYRYTR